MDCPFPGMDPYLEHPALWPDVHNSLIIAIANSFSEFVAPRYYVALKHRSYWLHPEHIVIAKTEGRQRLPLATAAVMEVEVPMTDQVSENYLEVHEVTSGRLVTIMELLSPVNKLYARGREDYERKRMQVFSSRTNLVEVDLLRDGEPLPLARPAAKSDYRILVSRGTRRPRAQLYLFGLRDRIPTFELPMLPGDDEPLVDLNSILHALYRRARFDLRLDYSRPAVPPLPEANAAWAASLLLGSP